MRNIATCVKPFTHNFLDKMNLKPILRKFSRFRRILCFRHTVINSPAIAGRLWETCAILSQVVDSDKYLVGYLLYDVIIKNLYIISLILISERHVRQPTDTYYKSYRSTVVCFSKRVDAFCDFQQSFLTEQHHICNFTYFEYIKIHAVQ